MTIQSDNNSQAYNGMPSPRASIASANEGDTAEIIKIPDIFELFMSRPPTLNPLYENVRVQALEWANK
jgi:hypothetical protein